MTLSRKRDTSQKSLPVMYKFAAENLMPGYPVKGLQEINVFIKIFLQVFS